MEVKLFEFIQTIEIINSKVLNLQNSTESQADEPLMIMTNTGKE